ncbi:type IV toxin-antitoxin system YeeU family antitoxin [Enterobacter asburiae]|uniref:type IV toxin-antitoxin system YeeU family antitoxin n=1 Tax=Enterobacter asburiae TaxID=61645 RepID=UPI00336188D8
MQNSWGLKRDISPCFGARLVQEGCRLHFLADRAGISGTFNEEEALRLDQAFPLVCEADTLGSHGYVYIVIYPQTSSQ